MKDYIFKYLDKRYPIKDKIAYFIDVNPAKHLECLFGVENGTDTIHQWLVDRIGETYTIKFKCGQTLYFKLGDYHRIGGPAIAHADGYTAWYQNGERHRLDGPAIIYPNGGEGWYKNGQLHRDDGPAVIYPNGEKQWWQNGKYLK